MKTPFTGRGFSLAELMIATALGSLLIAAALKFYASARSAWLSAENLAELEERSKKGYVSSFWTALIYMALGEVDKSFVWFEKAYEERDGNMIYFTVVPIFGPVRADPRYKELLLKMGHDNLVSKLTR